MMTEAEKRKQREREEDERRRRNNQVPFSSDNGVAWSTPVADSGYSSPCSSDSGSSCGGGCD
ncbi:hypothetical protein pf16_09 [Pseudomonas phage pf16]|uniref:Uncharacterized protein n=1 Tax=Pseudomonas phage pf16 TaxID=1815630 RepID=A0A1S5R3G4_9CAUD|nr:hypothetical protein FDG98_gp008 [Pseudomonas phage pf16]AND74932.1 hypothetical protein pf16_09 [Pseudomonas phage pf16]